ncbi:hypothetical protein Mal64_23770 [Pseudobythopirellula maris]|uniref:DUF3137 domain-containing protein n=1 Tax=Pseudobythopirellula maris TaxID=2527991 RepID=A0A5C5ZPQ2_9BACT|nr:hypothetical protein [Pseudobythopirellula maris]TWT88887.1 hypothetical protein Mal64_23770 [Pseudobythopirellula maris]
MAVVAFFCLIAVFFVTVAVLGGRQAKLRSEKLAGLAGELGWSFEPSANRRLPHRYEPFRRFSQGHSQRIFNTLAGTAAAMGEECHAWTGDFLYKTTSRQGKKTTTHTHRFSYLLLELPISPAPEMAVRGEGMFDKLAGWFGMDDIDFESAEFSDRFHVTGSDKRFTYDLMHPRMMEFLLDGSPPDISLSGRYCLLTRRNGLWEPEAFRATLAWAERFCQLWPEHVLSELRA